MRRERAWAPPPPQAGVPFPRRRGREQGGPARTTKETGRGRVEARERGGLDKPPQGYTAGASSNSPSPTKHKVWRATTCGRSGRLRRGHGPVPRLGVLFGGARTCNLEEGSGWLGEMSGGVARAFTTKIRRQLGWWLDTRLDIATPFPSQAGTKQASKPGLHRTPSVTFGCFCIHTDTTVVPKPTHLSSLNTKRTTTTPPLPPERERETRPAATCPGSCQTRPPRPRPGTCARA